ncbi:MAG: F0F1 ATP synthase subunit A [Bacteroidota bacterium]
MRILLISFALLLGLTLPASAQDHSGETHHSEETEQHDNHDHGSEADHGDHDGHDEGKHGDHADHEENDHGDHAGHGDHHGCACHEEHGTEDFEPAAAAFHHIADANAFHIWGDIYLPLPCILYAPDHGLTTMLSSKFEMEHHGTGKKAIDRYVLFEGAVMRVASADFPMGEVELDCASHVEHDDHHTPAVVYQGTCYELEGKSTLDGGVFGGGITSYYDFSITKNVATMLLVFFLLLFVFRNIANAYKKRQGLAPSGVQGFFEPIILFIQDEVAKPFLGHKYDRYLPFLLSLFFFILGLNLIGQIPFFPGSANVTGNLGVTFVLAIFTFLVVNLSGNKHYWEHIFWMPGVPAWVKTILTPVEFLGLFIKPFTLMLRLFANITAGHIVILSFVGLIFIFGESGTNPGGAGVGVAASVPLTMFMMAIELLVAFIQAFVFTLLTASYIGQAVEEAHH